jgi:general nucleoside transport system permease protein
MNQVLGILPICLGFSTPLILAALGGLFSERSGVVNIAIEGIMMVGAFIAATVVVFLEAGLSNHPELTFWVPWIGLLAGSVAGLAYSVLHAVTCVNLRADHVISGTALNILASGLTIFLCQIIFHQQRTNSFSIGMTKVDLPLLKDIPILGTLLFRNVYPTFYLALILTAAAWFVLYKTPFGLRLRASGENPQAAASMGISVYAMRYWGVLISGALAGLAGGTLVLTSDIQYTVLSIHGSGFIAIACLIFGKWKPFGLFAAGIFFGASQVLSLYAKDIFFLARVPREIFQLFPYVLTVFALILFSGRAVGPKAAGEIFDPGKR